MLINSYTYLLIFLPVVFFIYHLFNNLKLKNSLKIFLIIASLIFYTYLDFSNFIIIFISISFKLCWLYFKKKGIYLL